MSLKDRYIMIIFGHILDFGRIYLSYFPLAYHWMIKFSSLAGL